MITGTHAMLYVEDADATRAFLRDVLGLASVDAGDGWLVFRLPPAEIGVHPVGKGDPLGGRHEVFLLCDDIHSTVADLRAKGATVSELSDQGWGLLVTVTVPGGAEFGLYQPRHPSPPDA